MKARLRRVVVDIGCGETLGALSAAVEAKAKGHVRLYRLSAAAPHSSDVGQTEMSSSQHAKYATMLQLAKLSNMKTPMGKCSYWYLRGCVHACVRVCACVYVYVGMCMYVCM